MTVNFVVVGHITHDLTSQGFRLGGTVSYAAVTALRLGWRPGIVTRGTAEGLRNVRMPDDPSTFVASSPGPLAGIPVCLVPSPVSTTFANIYREGRRSQVIEALAEPLLPQELPGQWASAPVVLLGPIAREVPPEWVMAFPQALIGVTPQGWMRAWDEQGHVYPARWENAELFLRRADVVILSREDIGGDEAYLANLAGEARLLVVTDGWHGATLYAGGERRRVPPRPTTEVDPTGAGDVFATAFLLRLAETGDAFGAARFANVVASMSVEAPGMDAIPDRGQVDYWLRQNG